MDAGILVDGEAIGHARDEIRDMPAAFGFPLGQADTPAFGQRARILAIGHEKRRNHVACAFGGLLLIGMIIEALVHEGFQAAFLGLHGG